MKLSSSQIRDTKFAYMISAPMIIYICTILVFPVAWGISLSFTNKAIGGNPKFIGLDNYIQLLGNKDFLSSILNTLVYTFFSIGGKILFGVIMALALNIDFRGKNIVRAFLIIPWTLPNIVSVLNWKWIFTGTGGVANYILKTTGIIEQDLIWFGSASLSMLVVVIVNIWRGTPFFGLSILARLQTIPKDYYEAAEVDGASILQKFIHITLPSIADAILITALVSTIWTLNEFESVWLLTGGGPNRATELASIYSYKTAMTGMRLGRGIAVSVLMMPFLIVLIHFVSKKMLKDD
ncbi:MAG: sugar ABC transporter permease [Spirochaetales bacterium]